MYFVNLSFSSPINRFAAYNVQGMAFDISCSCGMPQSVDAIANIILQNLKSFDMAASDMLYMPCHFSKKRVIM